MSRDLQLTNYSSYFIIFDIQILHEESNTKSLEPLYGNSSSKKIKK